MGGMNKRQRKKRAKQEAADLVWFSHILRRMAAVMRPMDRARDEMLDLIAGGGK